MESKTNQKEWNITIEQERKFWINILLGKFINIPEVCIYCNKGNVNIRNNNSIINPVLGKCNNYLCNREKYLRIGTIFEPFNRTPASVIYNILDLWLNNEFNAEKISTKLTSLYEVDKVNKAFILKVLKQFRVYIANYYRDLYSLETIAPRNGYNHIAIDESLFTHCDGVQQWVIGMINSETNLIRLEVVESRDTDTLKKIITKHINVGNYVITDSWPGYTFLNNANSGYIHYTYNHSRGNFGSGLTSTSRIEAVWNELKGKFKRIYNTIKSKHFIYFLRECEYRRSIKDLKSEDKMLNFSVLFSCVGIRTDDEYLSEKELLSLDYETNFDD